MLSRLKIGTKVAAIAAVTSLIGIMGSGYAATVIRSADDDYSAMIENLDKSSNYLARISRLTNEMGYDVYRAIAYDGDEATSAAKMATAAIEEANTYLSEVSSRLTDRRQEVDEIHRDLASISDAIAKAADFGASNQNEAARSIMQTIDSKIIALSGEIKTLNDETSRRVDARSDELTGASYRNAYLLLGGSIIGAVAGLVLALWVSARGITGPLNLLGQRMKELASGRLDVPVEGTDRGDEVGAMAKAVQVFKEAANQNKRLEQEAAEASRDQAASRDRQAAIDNARAEDLRAFVHAVEAGFDKLSSGDLTTRMNQAVASEFEPIRAKFNASVAQLEDTIGSVVGAVGSMRVGLNQITVAAGDLSQRTEQQAASLEETVAALSEVMHGVNQTAQSADDAKVATTLAQTEATKGGHVVSEAVAAMAEIEQSSHKIGSIISVIDEIAFQTNLLALNAGVEAARAGEAGRGFAVVAQEVRGLAQRSAEAAKEIKDLIQASANQVGQGVELVSATGRSLEQITTQVEGVARVITEMARSAREQAVSLKEVSVAADQMDKVTQQNAAMVEQTTAAAQSLVGETTELAALTERFRVSAATAGNGRPMRPAAARAAAPSRSSSPAPVRQMRPATQAQPAKDDWEEF